MWRATPRYSLQIFLGKLTSDMKSISTSFLYLYYVPQSRPTKLSSLLTLDHDASIDAIKGSRRWNSRGRPEISSPRVDDVASAGKSRRIHLAIQWSRIANPCWRRILTETWLDVVYNSVGVAYTRYRMSKGVAIP